jgi:hypothetical protein
MTQSTLSTCTNLTFGHWSITIQASYKSDWLGKLKHINKKKKK